MSKSAKSGPRPRTPNQDVAAAKVALATENTIEKPGTVEASPFESAAKRRCQGATRYGQPCALWAAAGGDYCYWCERAGRPRVPPPRPAGEPASRAGNPRSRKQRCRGVTVFGEPCGYYSAGEGGLCLWCQGADKRGRTTQTHQ